MEYNFYHSINTNKVAVLGLAGLALFGLNNLLNYSGFNLAVSEIKSSPAQNLAAQSLTKLPLYFESNQGQTAEQVKYLSRGFGYTMFFLADKIILAVKKNSLELNFIDSSAQTSISGIHKLAGISNYFIGKDPQKWHTNIPHFEKIQYQDLYPGVSAVFYGNQHNLEYDFKIAPHADPAQIKLNLRGAALKLAANGDLVLTFADQQKITMHKPLVYQNIAGKKQEIAANFLILKDNLVGFELGAYDKNQEVIIDPALTYSTYVGGSGGDEGARAIATYDDGSGIPGSITTFVGGYTNSINFPVTSGVAQTSFGGEKDGYVFRLDPRNDINPNDQLKYSTYLGGTNIDQVNGIAVDNQGNAYVTGYTYSDDFPITSGVFQEKLNVDGHSGPSDAFVTELKIDGSLIFSTYMGGPEEDQANGISLCFNTQGYEGVFLTGFTNSKYDPDNPWPFPYQYLYGNEFQQQLAGGTDAFLTKMSFDGTAVIHSTYLGGTADDVGYSVVGDIDGYFYVTGQTASADFPVSSSGNPSFQSALNGLTDAFVSQMDTKLVSLIYTTYLGGNAADAGYAITIDNKDVAGLGGKHQNYITGFTQSSDYPTQNGYSSQLNGNQNIIVSKLDYSLTNLLYSTYLSNPGSSGSGDGEAGYGIAIYQSLPDLFQSFRHLLARQVTPVDQGIYVSGATTSANFPLVEAVQSSNKSGNGLTTTLSFLDTNQIGTASLLFSSYVGGNGGNEIAYGVATDVNGKAYVAGTTNSPSGSNTVANSFPVSSNPYQSSNPSYDAEFQDSGNSSFVYVLDLSSTPPPAPPTPGAILAHPYYCHRPVPLRLAKLRILPVAIVGSSNFNLADLNTSSLSLSGAPVISCNKSVETLPNGSLGLICKFDLKAGNFLPGLTNTICRNTGHLADLTLTGIINSTEFSATAEQVCVMPSTTCSES